MTEDGLALLAAFANNGTLVETDRKESDMNTNLNDAIRLFVLNLPEILELRNRPEYAPPTNDDGIRAIVADAIENYEQNDLSYAVESVLEDMDFESKVETVLNYGFIDITSKVDGDELLGQSREFNVLSDTVNDLESKVKELERRIEAAAERLQG
jgi:hypothetical protein